MARASVQLGFGARGCACPWVALAICGGVACGAADLPRAAPDPDASGRPTSRLDYHLAFAADLSQVVVDLCFASAVPRRLWPGVNAAAGRVHDVARRASDGGEHPLARVGGSIDLRSLRAGECVRYTVDLREVAGRYQSMRLLGSGEILWRPGRSAWPRFADIVVRASVAGGGAFVAPWPEREPGEYRPDVSVFGLRSRVVVGRFDEHRFTAAGARLRVVVAPGVAPAVRSAIEPWLGGAARATAALSGRFPAPTLMVALVPGRPDEDQISFGFITRGGGAAVTFHVGGGADLASLAADWTTVHEFSHLWMPFVRRPDAWLSEGIATYYQEVLRARAGMHPPTRAWRRLLDGARRGHGARASLEQESARMFERFSFRKVYWGGAAFALLADVEVRRVTGGAQSLDSAIVAIHRDRPPQTRGRAAWSVLADLDRAAGTTVFRDLARRYVRRLPYPPIEGLLEPLGLRVAAGRIAYGAGELSGFRDAIMGTRRRPGPARSPTDPGG